MLHQKALWIFLAATFLVAGQTSAIERVAAKHAYVVTGFGYAMPQGEYNGLPGNDFVDADGRSVTIDAGNLYKDGYAFTLGYGQLVGGKWLFGITFDYTRNEVENPIIQTGYDPVYLLETNTYHHFALTVRPAWAPLDIRTKGWSPFVGPSLSFGVAALTAPRYATEYEATFGMDIDFGLDIRLWKSPDSRSFVTLSSLNSWNFVATGDRVSHLQIGGGLKYFFKP